MGEVNVGEVRLQVTRGALIRWIHRNGGTRPASFHTSSRESFLFHVVAKYGAKQAMTEDVLGLLAQMAATTRREPGNVSYDFYRGLEDPTQIVILESYHDAEDFDRHRESQHFLDVGVRQIIPRLVSRQVSTYISEDMPHEVP